MVIMSLPDIVMEFRMGETDEENEHAPGSSIDFVWGDD